MVEPLPLQALPEVLGAPYDRLLVALLAVAAILLIGRILLSLAWKLVVVATLIVGVVGVASAFGVI